MEQTDDYRLVFKLTYRLDEYPREIFNAEGRLAILSQDCDKCIEQLYSLGWAHGVNIKRLAPESIPEAEELLAAIKKAGNASLRQQQMIAMLQREYDVLLAGCKLESARTELRAAETCSKPIAVGA